MGLLAILDRHASLFGRMADSVGADLAEAAQRGEIAEGTVRSAVLSCTACSHTGDCETWLESHGPGAGAAPDYCRNKAMLDRLALR